MGKTICVCLVGTRPEVIKMAPVIESLVASDWAQPLVVSIGQHTELLTQAIADFGLVADHHIAIDRQRGSVLEVASQAMDRLDALIDETGAACVVAQGDTTTVMAAALVAFYRRVAALGVRLHCAPTPQAAQKLRDEGIAEDTILQSGNTVIYALLETAQKRPQLPADFPKVPRPILVTAHRRESFGPQIEEAFAALREAVDRYPDIGLYFPVHPNPQYSRRGPSSSRRA